MSAYTENKAFIEAIVGSSNINYDGNTFGLWVSTFQQINHSDNGYSVPEPLVEDVLGANFSVVGKTYSLTSLEGEFPKARFFLTSGQKGVDGYSKLVPIFDITDTFVSQDDPVITLPDFAAAGKIYRKTEITGYKPALIGNGQVYAVSGEDWTDTGLTPASAGTTSEFSYTDTNYVGYSNEVTTRYKFLFNNSDNSNERDFSSYEIPIKLEKGTKLRYRISRKSDPLGTYYSPQVTSDGKVIIDYSQYRNEVSGFVDSSLQYSWQQLSKITISPEQLTKINSNVPVTLPVNDNSLIGVQVNKVQNDGEDAFEFKLLATGDYSDIYNIDFEINRFFLTDKSVNGYVLTDINVGNPVVSKHISLSVGDSVYPRTIENAKYNSNELSTLANVTSLIESENAAQNTDIQSQNITTQEIGTTISDYYSSVLDEINNDLADDSLTANEKDIESLRLLDILDQNTLTDNNDKTISYEVPLPKFPLPKQNVDRSYYSNYLNSGESYVSIPLSTYTLGSNYIYYADKFGQVGYSINPANDGFFRSVVNSTCDGILVNQTGVCNGDTAIFSNPNQSLGIYYENGRVTSIPDNGVISKADYYSSYQNWRSAVNYFYTKNYLSSYNVLPAHTDQEKTILLSKALAESISLAGKPLNDPNYPKGSTNVYVEREIYVEEYNNLQSAELNSQIAELVKIPTAADLSVAKQEKLYCIQTFDNSDFTETKEEFYLKSRKYNEILKFEKFYEKTRDSISYSTGDNYGIVYFSDANTSSYLYRLEYVTMTAFQYVYTTSFRAWSGTNGGTISISGQDNLNYSYHLYSYTSSTDTLTFEKSNVKNGDLATLSHTNGVVLKFIRLGFTDSIGKVKSGDKIFNTITSSVTDSGGTVYADGSIFFNIQKYSYQIEENPSSYWKTYSEAPVNDNRYGKEPADNSQPRFFEDASDDQKQAALAFYLFPNGPSTSKNYEGSPVARTSFNALKDEIFSNTISIKEESSDLTTINSVSILDFEQNGNLSKQKAPSDIKSVLFTDVRRLKITKVKYSFYTKDLVIIGDAGFPYSTVYNSGWEYKLQYRQFGSDAWLTLPEVSSFSNEKLGVQTSFISPLFITLEKSTYPTSLPMVACKTNLSKFLNDNNFEFRIFKYEKVDVLSENLDIIRKTEFLPINVSWTNNPNVSYYNIYQRDVDGNLKLIQTEIKDRDSSYCLPSVKQTVVNSGPQNFGAPNGYGYYDVTVSGFIPTSTDSNANVSNQFGNLPIGNSSDLINVKTRIPSQNGSYVNISSPTYSSIISFNNPDGKTSQFEITENYNEYYLTTNSAGATVGSVSSTFEGYVANTGVSSCLVGGQTVNAGNYAKILGGSVTTATTASLPSATLSADDFGDGEAVYLTQSYSIAVLSSGPKTFILINDSSSSITVTYNANPYVLAANSSYKAVFTTTDITLGSALANVDIDSSYIFSSNPLVNLGQSAMILKNAVTDMPVYNLAQNNLLVNSLLTVPSDSFDLVSWDGVTTPTLSTKDYFDGIKIYLSEFDLSTTTLLKDDTDIILDQFSTSSEAQIKEYFFLKDESIVRSLNIRIINGTDIRNISVSNQDFKLSLNKKDSVIRYSIVYASNSPNFDILDKKEQLVVIKGKVGQDTQYVDLGYIESVLHKGSFIYFVNRSKSDLIFYKHDKSVTIYKLTFGQAARVRLNSNAVAQFSTVDPVAGADSHFEFYLDPAIYATSDLNIIDLQFCGANILLPSVSSLQDKNVLLLSKNRILANKLNHTQYQTSSADTVEVADIQNGDLGSFTLGLNVTGTVGNTVPTVSRSNFTKQLLEIDKLPQPDELTEYFYVSDTAQTSLSIRDYYAREAGYNGRVFLNSPRQFSVSSFDENSTYNLNGENFEFNYDPDETLNGRLEVKLKKDAIIIDDSSPTYTESTLQANQFAINFSFDLITITGVAALKKNRLVKKLSPNYVYPVYNRDEFFIGRAVSNRQNIDGTGQLLYRITSIDTDIQKIIVPDSGITESIILKNESSVPYSVETLSGTSVVTISPNEQKKLAYSAGWTASSDTSTYVDLNSTTVCNQSQSVEIDSGHPLIDFGLTSDPYAIQKRFTELGAETEIIIDSSTYTVVDLYANYTNASSSGDLFFYCYGRIYSQLSNNHSLLVNNLYLNVQFNESLVPLGMVYDPNNSRLDSNKTAPLKIVKSKKIDLLKIFLNEGSLAALPDVILVPFYSEQVTYYLPNLLTAYLTGTVGDVLNKKKIVFVNLVKNGSSAPNVVSNLGSSPQSLYEINEVIVYTASTTAWTKDTTGIPSVQKAVPTLKDVRGLVETSTSEVSSGRELVYLPNFKKFKFSIESFQNRSFNQFYVVNSCNYSLTISKDSKSYSLNSNKFLKVTFGETDTPTLSSIPLGGASSFSSVSLGETNKLDQAVMETFTNLKVGSRIKASATFKGATETAFYRARMINQDNETVIKLEKEQITDSNYGVLNVQDLLNYEPNSQLFVYGSSQKNEFGASFDTYNLKLTNVTTLANKKFFVYNNTNKPLYLYIDKNSQNFIIPSKRMIQISTDSNKVGSIVFAESYQKDKALVSKNYKNINYLLRSNIQTDVDAMVNQTVFAGFTNEADESKNILFTNLISNRSSFKIYSYSQSSDGSSVSKDWLSDWVISFTNLDSFDFAKAIDQRAINKPSLSISSAGHYILTNNNYHINLQNSASEAFLVNCSSSDLRVWVDGGTEAKILYRNSTFVSSTSSKRYLKKGKSKDEFYCIFSPGTLISTTRETALSLDPPILRFQDFFKILDDDSKEQVSYIKFLYNDGSSSTVNLELRDYYNGIDIPTTISGSPVAYEVGNGHETIYKFQFFDAVNSLYTLPGVQSGQKYIVKINTSLFEGLSMLPSDIGEEEKIDPPYVKYMGNQYTDGETFIGGKSSWYEVKYPNYVSVSKVIEEIQPAVPVGPGADSIVDDLSGLSTVDTEIDDDSIFRAIIFSDLAGKLGSQIVWLPIGENAVWLESSFVKDVWIIDSITGSDTKTISYNGRQLSFTKCSLKKLGMKSPVASLKFPLYSALQDKIGFPTPQEALFGIDEDLTDGDRVILTNNFKNLYNKADYISPIPVYNLTTGPLNYSSLFINNSASQVNNSTFEIVVTVKKLNSLPTVIMDDFSQAAIIKQLNGKL